MKKVMYTIALLFAGVTMLMAQADYKMWRTVYVQPKIDKIPEFEEALAAHNKKYHNEGNKKVSVWYNFTGSNAGKYVLAMGPLTFSDFDSYETNQAHDDDWNDNVLPYVKSESNFEFWKLNENLSNTPEGSSTGKEVFRIYDIKHWQMYRFKTLLEKVSEVHKKHPQENYFLVYESQFYANDGRDIALAFGLKTWSELDSDYKFSKDYEEVHGEGSWHLFLEELKEVVVGREDELTMFRKDLSGGQ